MDPAEQWVFNPATGSYELRPPGRPRAHPSAPTGTRPPYRGAPPPRGGTGQRPGPPRERGPGDGPAGHREPMGRREPAGHRERAGHREGSGHREAPDRTGPPRQRRAPGAGDRPPPGGGDRGLPPQRDRRAPRGRRKPKKRSLRKKILLWTGGILALLLLVGCTTLYLAYQRLNNNITKVDVPYDNPATSDEAVNILLIGSDERIGEGNSGYGDRDSVGHAETTVLLHFAKDRKHATALSIPRDLIVDIPDCETKQDDGTTVTIPGAQGVRFNESYGQQGRDPGCTWKTVQEITGIEINHFMLVDFNAVKTLSTAVGGVEVCLNKDIDDDKSKLKLSAGRHRIQGEDALAFVRTRKSVGHGGDLSRIELQQQFLGSMARELKASGTLSNPKKLWDLADAVTKALTVDTGIGDVQKLNDLARDLGRVPVKDISFVTLPVKDNPAEETPVTVVVDEAKALPLFRMIQEDKSLTEQAAEDAEEEGGKNGEGKPEPAPVSEVAVHVYNGGNVSGAARDTGDWLVAEGVGEAVVVGNAEEPQETTVLWYAPGQSDQAATLAKLMGLPAEALQETDAEAGETPMTLILGDDFRGAGTPIEIPAEKPDDLKTSTADDEDICAE